MGYSRKGAIDLSQKEAAVSGLFFNESLEYGEGRERKSKKGEGEASPLDGKMEFSRGKMEF